MSQEKCRWGILGSAGIAQKNWQSIRNAGNAELVAVASRDVGRAQDFIDRCSSGFLIRQPPKPSGTTMKCWPTKRLTRSICLCPPGLRAEWAIKAAQAGKHLLCEKPCGIDLEELDEILAACKEAGVQFMDGVMFMHSDRLKDLRKTLDDGESVGKLRRIATQFSFCAPEEFLTGNIRMHSDLEPQGCMGDLGWYNLRFILWTMNYQVPRAVTGRLLNASGRADSPKPSRPSFRAKSFSTGTPPHPITVPS